MVEKREVDVALIAVVVDDNRTRLPSLLFHPRNEPPSGGETVQPRDVTAESIRDAAIHPCWKCASEPPLNA